MTLGKLEPAVLATHAPAIVAKLEDSVDGVREVAVETLGKLKPAVLATHAPAIVAKLEDSERSVRRVAVETLGKLEPAVLATHAPAIVAKLEDSERIVRRVAVETLGKLEPAVLATHAPAIVAKLEDSEWIVRPVAVETLGKLEPAVLATHAPAIVAKLEDSDVSVRRVAVETLEKLEPAVLATHAPAIVAAEAPRERARGGGALGRGAAVLARRARTCSSAPARVRGGEETLGAQPAVLATHAPAIVAKLEDSVERVSLWAVETLRKLEMLGEFEALDPAVQLCMQAVETKKAARKRKWAADEGEKSPRADVDQKAD